MDALLVLLVLGILALATGFGIRHRSSIAKWLNDPYSDTAFRRKELNRRIEDAQDELAKLDKLVEK